jgi:tRNA-splicing ligase RtcB
MTTFKSGNISLNQIEEFIWEIPRSGDMLVPARIFASENLLKQISQDKTLEQLKNTASLPGIQKYAICMPDGHQGYGFPVGGVVATDANDGCISPGGVGYDINCGVRMIKTNLSYKDLRGKEELLGELLFSKIPTGLGKGGVLNTSLKDIEEILSLGVEWALDNGYAVPEDLDFCEDRGRRLDADPTKISLRAKKRGKNQVGSLGSGNHFLEIQRVVEIFKDEVAHSYGLSQNQVVILIHTGSRGLGHQTCTDYLRKIEVEHATLLSNLPDRELAAAPSGSQLALDYYAAMCACINFAWTNRQILTYAVRLVFEELFNKSWQDLGMDLLYDVAHNIAKKEFHMVDGIKRELFVHRKGATRAFPIGNPELPLAFRNVGQPIIIPGSMGSDSYILRGGAASLDLTFGSTAHGAGRILSRTKAKKLFKASEVQAKLKEQNIYVTATLDATISEEAPGVYKDVSEVVNISDSLGIGDKVARTYPVVNIKG